MNTKNLNLDSYQEFQKEEFILDVQAQRRSIDGEGILIDHVGNSVDVYILSRDEHFINRYASAFLLTNDLIYKGAAENLRSMYALKYKKLNKDALLVDYDGLNDSYFNTGGWKSITRKCNIIFSSEIVEEINTQEVYGEIGFLQKSFSDAKSIDVIRSLLFDYPPYSRVVNQLKEIFQLYRGDGYMEWELLSFYLDDPQRKPDPSLFTKREFDIILLTKQGNSIGEIAKKLKITVFDIKKDLVKILTKLV